MKKNIDYNIGLDIGTNSVGYAVVDTKGNLLKFKEKNMWGVNLFEQGQSAKTRRLSRSTRRRYLRRKNRIQLLQQMLYEDITKVDEQFYLRLSQSSLWHDDKTVSGEYTFFNELGLTDKDYYKMFPTIYHLRKYLSTTTEKVDIRLIYLALHHIVKYRGNFLYEGQKLDAKSSLQFELLIEELLDCLTVFIEIPDIDEKAVKIYHILIDNNCGKSEKLEHLTDLFHSDKENKQLYQNLAKALLGRKANFKLIFDLDDISQENLSFYLSDEDAEEKIMENLDDNQIELFEAIQKVYSAVILVDILKDQSTLSEAMIAKYEKHKYDLKTLKSIYRIYFPTKFREMFRGNKYPSKAKNDVVNYTSYIYGEKKCTKEDLFKKIKSTLAQYQPNSSEQENFIYCLNEIENDTFLPKLNEKTNGAIPYQLHLNELNSIIQNQEQNYPSLKTYESRLKTLVTFRIPYYIGPLNSPKSYKNHPSFAWMERRIKGAKIYPWNFNEIVDVDKSAEKFITRMTNKCTYLPKEDTIPKKSLLYAEYEVLNELKQIKVDGHFLPHSIKEAIYEDLFQKQKNISIDTLKKYLINIHKYKQNIEITGTQSEGKFASSLTAYLDFSNPKIFGEVNYSNKKYIEQLVLWLTLFNDKNILKRKISNQMPEFSEQQIENICKLQYSGWSRLSRRLLNGIAIINTKGNRQTIIDIMRTTNKNFMQIINDDELGFDALIADEAKLESAAQITDEMIDSLQGSPAIKRGIKQSVAVVEELVRIMDHPPVKICIEFAREEGEKVRTTSRGNKLLKQYENYSRNPEYQEIYNELKENSKKLDNRMLYLYFLQHGKSLYSDKKLNIEQLASTCQIDHIIPQSYIKNDSLDNLALVLAGENQDKSDDMLIGRKIIQSQKAYWTELLRGGFISQRKFDNLTKEIITENEYKGFINRQLVETRQIIKHVTNLFTSVYTGSRIIEIKAGLTSDIRMQYELYKVREINDYHHAHDAYLAVTLGRYVEICYPNLKEEFDYNEYRHFAANKENASRTAKFGYIAGRFGRIVCDKKSGKVIWNGVSEVQSLHQRLNFKDYYVSKKLEEQTGEFYNQTLYEKEKKNLQPRKANLPVEKYGGYSSEKDAYSVIVEYDAKNKREKKLFGIPIQIAKLSLLKPDATIQYLLSKGYKNPQVLRNKIMKYQKIIYNGHTYYLSSSDEIHNAYQLILPEYFQNIVFAMNRNKKNASIHETQLIELYDMLCQKIEKYYSCYESSLQKLLNARNDFLKVAPLQKIRILNEILKMTKANPERGNFGTSDLKFCNLSTSEGRKQVNLKINDVIFVNTSVTGLFENTVKGSEL